MTRYVPEQRAGLRLRIAAAIALSAMVGLLADRILDTAVPGLGAARVAVALAAACLGGLFLMGRAIAPLAESKAELQGRYEAAVAESLQDPLTGLGNHRAFQEELDRQVEHALRYEVAVSLVMIDLDEFKAINDGSGHAGGDRALASFGRVLTGGLRRVDRAFRVGGDEFAILLPHTDAEGAWMVTRRLLATALSPPVHDGESRSVSFSAGISALPAPATTRAQLFSQADAALYAAKRAGRTDVFVFDPSSAPDEPTVGSASAIAEVIARGQLRAVYQPIITLDNPRVIGMEGLIRPVDPAPFADAPSLFAAAAQSGHLAALEMTCVELQVAGARDLPADQFLSVNLSPAVIEAPEFSAASLISILTRHAFAADRLVLELTEHQPIGDIERVRTKLDACRRAGIRLAADDLGAGNAGLRLLSELRFDILKVDLSLVQRSSPGAPSSEVVSSVVGLAARTGALVIGEGVERPEQLQQLAALGVTAAQGFLLGRPEPLPASRAAPAFAVRRVPAPVRQVAEPGVAGGAPMHAWRRTIGLPT
ncbi:MAG: EAL domain-containing protein [Chloroflexota bacterium]|nr:EAL domain-containing protein [Chloroflexota bacterium]